MRRINYSNFSLIFFFFSVLSFLFSFRTIFNQQFHQLLFFIQNLLLVTHSQVLQFLLFLQFSKKLYKKQKLNINRKQKLLFFLFLFQKSCITISDKIVNLSLISLFFALFFFLNLFL